MWNVTEYQRFGDERSRPWLDLIARIPDGPVHRVVDLGCGTGGLTAILSERWPGARVTGVDSSPQMLAGARVHAIPDRLDFLEQDIARWRPEQPVDVVVSNAVLHWIPDHNHLLTNLTTALSPGGRLAVQMPGNFAAPSHTGIRELCRTPAWKERLEGVVHPDHVHPLDWYVERLFALGFHSVDAWETTYSHILQGDDAVLHWVKGTALRPVLDRLDTDGQARFLEELGALLRPHYPRRAYGTWFPFRRLFFVGTRS